jgi:probable rRNA maturation factor
MIETLVEDGRWSHVDPETISARCWEAVWGETGDPRLSRLTSALFTSDGDVQALNREWRNKDRPTNVLSFPAQEIPGLPEEAQPLGDLALAFETCTREAVEKGTEVADHTAHLLVHGLLHLLGYDHIEDPDAERMEALERRILARLGVADPY